MKKLRDKRMSRSVTLNCLKCMQTLTCDVMGQVILSYWMLNNVLQLCNVSTMVICIYTKVCVTLPLL